MAEGELDLRSLEGKISLRKICLERGSRWRPKNL
jgi:hypothetical protein